MNYLKMRAEAAIPASATVDETVCRACGSSSGAAAAYCSACGTPLLHDDLPVSHVGTRTRTGERLLAAYVIPGILITLFCLDTRPHRHRPGDRCLRQAPQG
jgi:predicted amidophosphoribosyltransferase